MPEQETAQMALYLILKELELHPKEYLQVLEYAENQMDAKNPGTVFAKRLRIFKRRVKAISDAANFSETIVMQRISRYASSIQNTLHKISTNFAAHEKAHDSEVPFIVPKKNRLFNWRGNTNT